MNHDLSEFQPIPGVFVVGFGHRARHGKDSAAQFIGEAYPKDVRRFSFADALYAHCRIEHGMTRKDGPLLQRVGVAKREIDPHVWIRALYWAIADNPRPIVLITDVRFKNEAAFVKRLGGVCIKVERRLSSGELYVAADRDPNHVTETDLAIHAWDEVITNREGEIDRFRRDVLSRFLDVTEGVRG